MVSLTTLSSVLHFGPGKLISEFDGGSNFLYLGTLSKDIHGSWDLPRETCSSCASSSISRLQELSPGEFKTNCLIQALVRGIDTNEWGQVNWVVPRLPPDYSLYSDKLLDAVVKTGVVSAIRYATMMEDKGIARPSIGIAAIEAVRRGHVDAAKYLYGRFEDDWRLRRVIIVEASAKGDTTLIKWLAGTTDRWPSEGTYALLHGGHVEALDALKGSISENSLFDSGKVILYAALGGHLETVIWVFENSPTNPIDTMDDRELCLMVCTSGHLDVLKYLVCSKGFRLNKRDCIRFARKGSGIDRWLNEDS